MASSGARCTSKCLLASWHVHGSTLMQNLTNNVLPSLEIIEAFGYNYAFPMTDLSKIGIHVSSPIIELDNSSPL